MGSDAAGIREQQPVSRGFVVLYALAYVGTILLFLAPLMVSLSLKVNALVGTERAPNSLSLVTGTGAFLAMFGEAGTVQPTTSPNSCFSPPWPCPVLSSSRP